MHNQQSKTTKLASSSSCIGHKATRLLLENGKASSGKRTRHLNIRCFYLHDLIKKKLMEENILVNFEYTARNTPQQNGKVERSFATLFGRMRFMMIAAGPDYDSRLVPYAQAAAS